MAWEKQLEEMDFDRLTLWLWEVLNGGNPDPMPTMDPIAPYEYAEMAYERISRPVFRFRMHKAITNLFTKFNLEINYSTPELWYFANLSYLIARLKVTDAKIELLSKINDGYFINRPSDKFSLPFVAPDLQFLLLKVLIEFRDLDTIETFIRFFSENEGLYSHICYRGLWECDRRLGLTYLLELARIYDSQQEKPFNFVLEFGFFLKNHFLFFLEEYDKVFPNRPANKLERGVKDLLKRGINEFMRQSNLDFDFPNDEKVFIVRNDPGSNNIYETVFVVSSSMSTIRLLLLSRLSHPNQIIQQLTYAGQPCDPNLMLCYQIAPEPLAD